MDLCLDRKKVSIIGCGAVGMRYAYALLLKGGIRELVLLDADTQKLQGEAMDLRHAVPYSSPVEIVAGGYQDLQGSDIVVITAGKKQKPGQTRIDLVKDNVVLFKGMIPEIMKYAANSIFLVVSNPVDILSFVTYKLSGKAPSTVIGSGTVLDSARLRFLLGNHCKVDPRNVHAYVLGEHGDTEFPVWSKAMIGGVTLAEYCPFCHQNGVCNPQKTLQNIFTEVRDAASHIIQYKGETSYGIGMALVRISQAILNDENAILPVSSLVQDYLGIKDVYLSIPAVINRGGIREILDIHMSSLEVDHFQNSAFTLKKIIQEIGL